MAIISHTQKFIYILNPRTASTATAKALLENVDCEIIPSKDILDAAGKMAAPMKHTTIKQLRENGIVSDEVLERYFKFVTVRNPFDSLVSSWAKRTREYTHLLDDPNSWVFKKPGFAEGIRRAAGLSFPDWVRSEYGEIYKRGGASSVNLKFREDTNFSLRFEDLASGMNELAPKLGLPADFTVPQFNKTASRTNQDYRSYYDSEAREMVSSIFEQELTKLGYDF